jgi:hypothetical protein
MVWKVIGIVVAVIAVIVFVAIISSRGGGSFGR